jgi:hypothetical protein
MPPTSYDPNELARLLGEGRSLTEIAEIVDGPQTNHAAADQRRQLQSARSALNADAAPPGEMPDVDPYESALAAANRAGPRGSDRAFQAGVERIFEAAQAGDPRVMTQGTVDAKTREDWMAQAHERQAANRERSGWTRR